MNDKYRHTVSTTLNDGGMVLTMTLETDQSHPGWDLAIGEELANHIVGSVYGLLATASFSHTTLDRLADYIRDELPAPPSPES